MDPILDKNATFEMELSSHSAKHCFEFLFESYSRRPHEEGGTFVLSRSFFLFVLSHEIQTFIWCWLVILRLQIAHVLEDIIWTRFNSPIVWCCLQLSPRPMWCCSWAFLKRHHTHTGGELNHVIISLYQVESLFFWGQDMDLYRR